MTPLSNYRKRAEALLKKYFDKYQPYEGEAEQTLDQLTTAARDMAIEVIGEDERVKVPPTPPYTHKLSTNQLGHARNQLRRLQRSKLNPEEK